MDSQHGARWHITLAAAVTLFAAGALFGAGLARLAAGAPLAAAVFCLLGAALVWASSTRRGAPGA